MFHEQERAQKKVLILWMLIGAEFSYTEKVIDSGAYSGDDVHLSGA